MSRQPRRFGLTRVRFWWYAAALPVIVLLFVAPIEGWLPGEALVLGLFLFVFWLFSLAFAIYSRVTRPKELRQ
jgi:lysylphosphatidylglycerol synthetase-like protein (DUF2156 family)